MNKKKAIKEGLEEYEADIEEQIRLDIEYEQEMNEMREDMLMFQLNREEEEEKLDELTKQDWYDQMFEENSNEDYL